MNDQVVLMTLQTCETYSRLQLERSLNEEEMMMHHAALSCMTAYYRAMEQFINNDFTEKEEITDEASHDSP